MKKKQMYTHTHSHKNKNKKHVSDVKSSIANEVVTEEADKKLILADNESCNQSKTTSETAAAAAGESMETEEAADKHDPMENIVMSSGSK